MREAVGDCLWLAILLFVLSLTGGERTSPVVVEVLQLVGPLRYDAEGIFEEGDDDEESANCWEVSVELPVSFHPCIELVSRVPRSPWFPAGESTHGRMGSPIASRYSSILFVCCLMASSGLGSLVALLLLGPPKLF